MEDADAAAFTPDQVETLGHAFAGLKDDIRDDVDKSLYDRAHRAEGQP